ncbi:MAG: hypothetical protein WCE69_02685, partial [Aestuariivirga sp.]
LNGSFARQPHPGGTGRCETQSDGLPIRMISLAFGVAIDNAGIAAIGKSKYFPTGVNRIGSHCD